MTAYLSAASERSPLAHSALSAVKSADDVRDLLGPTPPEPADVRHYAHRSRYARTVRALHRIAIPNLKHGHADLIDVLHLRLAVDFQVSRLAATFGFCKPRQHRGGAGAVIAALRNKPFKRAAAERLLAAVGLVQTKDGNVQHIFECSADAPGIWPKQRRARAALLCFLIVITRRGDLPDQLYLAVRP